AVSVLSAFTPLYYLRDLASVQPSQNVLINGASSEIGVFAIQLAKYFGVEVTGVCSTANVELVKSLGADAVIDYTKTDFTQTGQTYDVIFDAVNKSSFSCCKQALTPTGIYMTTAASPAIMLQMLWTTIFGGKKAVLGLAGLNVDKKNFDTLKELFELGHLKAVIDRDYPLAEIVEAHRYVDTERKKGTVIITVAEE
ncbi:MAG: NAD(P)-dependent alcohol dehydrogenase, partial [Chloroflexota bacterium]